MPKYLFYLFLLSLPFGYRAILFQFTSGFDEYESAFLYASDILIVLFLIAFAALRKPDLPNIGRWFSEVGLHRISLLVLFLFFSGLSIFFAPIPLLALYNFIRLLLLVFTALAVARLLVARHLSHATILGLFAGLAVFESLIGFFQFLFQKSLGLWFLGESVLGPWVLGTAKFFVEGGALVRAYGTFPHPNVLGAYLILGLISLYYFWLQRPSEKKIWSGLPNLASDLLFGLGMFIILAGIVLAFSRTAWIVAVLASLAACIPPIFSKYWMQAVRLLFILFAIIYLLVITFFPIVFPRAEISALEPAVYYRLSYNRIGMSLIKDHPLGIGLGNQVIYSVKNDIYKNVGLTKVWEWQPIHNIYLLMASEIGALGLLVFLGFVISIIFNFKFLNVLKFRNWKLNKNLKFEIENFTPKIMLFSLLIFGMADHFLWTLEPGRLMLWVVMGVVLGSSAKARKEKHA